jgi:hypothetical protein
VIDTFGVSDPSAPLPVSGVAGALVAVLLLLDVGA